MHFFKVRQNRRLAFLGRGEKTREKKCSMLLPFLSTNTQTTVLVSSPLTTEKNREAEDRRKGLSVIKANLFRNAKSAKTWSKELFLQGPSSANFCFRSRGNVFDHDRSRGKQGTFAMHNKFWLLPVGSKVEDVGRFQEQGKLWLFKIETDGT